MINTNVPSIATCAAFVQLQDYRPPTKKEYVRYVRRLGDHCQCDPATFTEDQIRRYYLELRQVRKFGGSAMKVAKCARCSFFQDCLHLAGWTVLRTPDSPAPDPAAGAGAAFARALRQGRQGSVRAPLSPGMLVELRDWWKSHRHPTFLFPGPTTGGRERSQPADAAQRAETHLSVSAVQNTFRLALADSGLPAEATGRRCVIVDEAEFPRTIS